MAFRHNCPRLARRYGIGGDLLNQACQLNVGGTRIVVALEVDGRLTPPLKQRLRRLISTRPILLADEVGKGCVLEGKLVEPMPELRSTRIVERDRDIALATRLEVRHE
eukprot:1917287-Prymnesium_polylepis.1